MSVQRYKASYDGSFDCSCDVIKDDAGDLVKYKDYKDFKANCDQSLKTKICEIIESSMKDGSKLVAIGMLVYPKKPLTPEIIEAGKKLEGKAREILERAKQEIRHERV